jgi:predicted restriction endonuclease
MSKDWTKITLKQLKSKAKYQAHARIRELARKTYKQSTKQKFCICGYRRHYQVCHIKSINSFSDSTYISTINDLNNLIALCPTHHWELDHGHIDIQHYKAHTMQDGN